MNIIPNLACVLYLAGATCLLTMGAAQAATTVSVKVTVLAPLPCVLNGNQPIEVNFGDEVMTTRINGENYLTPVNYKFTCTEPPEKNGMRLLLAGTGAGFDGKLLQTNVDGLGIAFLNNGSRIALNSWQTFTFPDMPTGEFTASATLRVDYQ